MKKIFIAATFCCFVLYPTRFVLVNNSGRVISNIFIDDIGDYRFKGNLEDGAKIKLNAKYIKFSFFSDQATRLRIPNNISSATINQQGAVEFEERTCCLSCLCN